MKIQNYIGILENYEILRIPIDNHENQENLRIA